MQKSNANISDSLIIPNGRKDHDNRHWPEDWLNEGLKPLVVLFHFTKRIRGEHIFSFWYKYPLNQECYIYLCNKYIIQLGYTSTHLHLPITPCPLVTHFLFLSWLSWEYSFNSLVTLSSMPFSLVVQKSESEVAQSCPTLCDPVDYSPPGSSVHGILQARILERVTISFSRGSFWPRDRTQVSRIGGKCFNLWATREAQETKVVCESKQGKTGLEDLRKGMS